MLNRFRKKILSKKFPELEICETDGKIKISADFALGEINFYESENIVEMSVTSAADGENKFYLHFELRDLPYAEKLFEEMIQAMISLQNRRTLKILLTCTGGMTTGFFSERLNAAAEILSLDFEFSAAPFSGLGEVGEDFSVILLAPQVAYRLEEVEKIFPEKLVLKIPPRIFASYDVSAMIKFIREEFENYLDEREYMKKFLFLRRLIVMRNFFGKFLKSAQRLAAVAKKSWVEGCKYWCYDDPAIKSLK